jgi:hypothetical protein
MNIETKFDLGDTVYPVRECRKDHIETCEVCSGSGVVTVQESGKKIKCDECCGDGVKKSNLPNGYYFLGDSVGSVGKIEPEYYDKRYLRDGYHKNRIKYMLSSTGVGSGSIWYEDQLFASAEEAEAYCEEQNSKEQE